MSPRGIVPRPRGRLLRAPRPVGLHLECRPPRDHWWRRLHEWDEWICPCGKVWVYRFSPEGELGWDVHPGWEGSLDG